MVEIDMSDEKAEAELLALIRLHDSQIFSLIVSHDAGQWIVTIADDEAGIKAIGEGASFAEAWFQQEKASDRNA